MNMKIDIPVEGVNHFGNGLLEDLQAVCRYPNKPPIP